MKEREQLKDAIVALDAQRSVVGATITIREKASDLIRIGQGR
ncbi:MAG: hypothetical protein ACXW16_01090 [Burkholderiaceae bacterium]